MMVGIEELTERDLYLIRVSIGMYINHLEDRHHIYSAECPATGANSDKELKMILEKLRYKLDWSK